MDLEVLAKTFEEEHENDATTAVSEKQPAEISVEHFGVGMAIDDVKQKIVEKAVSKINDEKIIEKHSDSIARISDRALEVDSEKQRLIVERASADNKVVAQEIKNKLIVLKAEAKRLNIEQKQLNKEQKAAHKAKNKSAKWDLYKDKLQKMKYSYVPNAFILSMLLFFDGVKSFFDGIGVISTSILKALKWIIIIGLILVLIFTIPVTREWLLKILKL